jgi:hypothetical protein
LNRCQYGSERKENMNRKLFPVFSLIMLISLVIAGIAPVQAGGKDQWIQIPFPTSDGITQGIFSLEVFRGKLYASSSDYENGLTIWRMEKRGDWTQVSEAGFGNSLLATPEDFVVFKNMLYISTGDWNNRTVGQIWRTPDGNHWEPVTVDGFGQPNVDFFGRFAVYKNMIYVAAQMRWDDETPVGAQIWRSATGDSGTWEKVVDEGMGDNFSIGITSMAVFKGSLYAALETDWFHPVSIWRTNDGSTWEVVKNDGFGYPDPLPAESFMLNSPGSFAILKGYLYLGIAAVDLAAVDWEHPEINSSPAQIWRTKDGVNWEQVMKDGWGDWRNFKVDSLVTYNNQLYAATWGNNWAWGMPDGGTQVWRSPDGLHWTPSNEPGFGDSWNWVVHLGCAVTEYKGSLYYGTMNDAGGQIWKLSK